MVQKVVDTVKVINPDSITIYYKYNSWTVSEITLAKIDKLIAKAKLTNSKILIESYCDTTGSNISNIQLVTKRAENIAYYVKNYYPSEKIITKICDESYSIEADDALNRKSIVKLIK
jgi:outer membrane protein OmpA-like peptidoglycan-associated protein